MTNHSTEKPSGPGAALSIDETAKILNIHPGTVREGIRAGSIPSLRIGRRILIPRAKLEALLGEPL